MRTVLAVAMGLLFSIFLLSCSKTKNEMPAAVVSEEPVNAMDALASEIAGKKPDEVRAIIIKRFGEPTRISGSGICREHWDVEGGVLENVRGSEFPVFKKDGKYKRLYPYDNTVAGNLFGSYEMSTLPDKDNNGTSYWLGNVTLSEKYRYSYIDSESNMDHRAEQATNFFMLHVNGTYKFEYAKGVTGKTLLESLPDGSSVGTITCIAPGKPNGECFDIIVNISLMRLRFASKQGLRFDLDRSW
jgi:hypothetical protein